MIELGLLPLLVGLEIIILLAVLAVVLTIRSLSLSRRVRELQAGNPDVIEPASDPYKVYLRDELNKTRELLKQHAEAEDAPGWLAVRQDFLNLELEAQEVVDDPMAFQEKLDTGLQALLEQYRPPPEIVTETVQLVEEAAVEAEPEPAATAPARIAEDELHKKEVMRLRDLIGHQQDTMRNLRNELESRSGELDELEMIVAQLDAFEAQTTELVRCIEVLESENERLRQAREAGSVTGAGTSPEELNRLKDMVNEQQTTIGKLQGMLEQLRPEAGKAHELEDMINDVVKSNKELNTCIMVLEDENQSLRNQLDVLEAKAGTPAGDMSVDLAAFQQKIQELESLLEFKDATLEQLEQDIDRLRKAGSGAAGTEELEIKVQELEALLEFKEAAIEELEKQYAELEARYLELSSTEIPSH
jgi:predicted RNase H-like nuclease (RuvC/YqgF family)